MFMVAVVMVKFDLLVLLELQTLVVVEVEPLLVVKVVMVDKELLLLHIKAHKEVKVVL